MGQMIVGIIVVLIFFGIIYAFRGLNEKVDEYKAKRNPNDYKSLLKVAYRNIYNGEINKGVEQCEEILKNEPNNIVANLLVGVFNYKLENYEKANPVITKLVIRLLDDDLIMKLRFEDDNEALFALSYYYYGHICHLDENYQEAKKWKMKSFSINTIAKDFNLY